MTNLTYGYLDYFVDPVDGTDVEWTNWIEGEPNQRFETSYYGYMMLTAWDQYGDLNDHKGRNRNGKWNDVQSYETNPDEPDQRSRRAVADGSAIREWTQPQRKENNAFICVKDPQV